MTFIKRHVRVSLVASVASVMAILLVVASAWAHAVVYPKTSNVGAHERYVLRVPNEKDVATTRVEIRFPADVKVSSFADVPGWQLEVLTDTAKRIVGAVWTGSLPAHRFVEFPFVGANPKTASTVTWPTFQTYANGEKVEWTGATGSKLPASVTVIGGPAAAGAVRDVASWVSWAALLISIIALGLAIRRPQRLV